MAREAFWKADVEDILYHARNRIEDNGRGRVRNCRSRIAESHRNASQGPPLIYPRRDRGQSRRGLTRSPLRRKPCLVSIVQVQQLTKRFGTERVLTEIDFEIEAGQRVGFLGLNGAGKTTTLRILLGLLRADSGRVRVLGMDCWRHGRQIRREVGYLAGEVHFYPSLTGHQTLAFLARARGRDCRRGRDRPACGEIGTFSRQTGAALFCRDEQKLGLIQSLMHRPRLLILDEPTTALDPLYAKRCSTNWND